MEFRRSYSCSPAFRRRRQERSPLCFSWVFRFFVFAIYIVNVERTEDSQRERGKRENLHIDGLNYSLEKNEEGRRENERERE
jgi:hypothetical protein